MAAKPAAVLSDKSRKAKAGARTHAHAHTHSCDFLFTILNLAFLASLSCFLS